MCNLESGGSVGECMFFYDNRNEPIAIGKIYIMTKEKKPIIDYVDVVPEG